tara:strand:+ start:295 stop:663 length:369 start_codon:yes stop_codon:yes gene_type:complete
MTFAFWMILAAGFLPYLAVGYAKYDPKFNNHSPREFLAKQKGAKKRAFWAHENSFEVFPFFAAAVLVAHIAGADQVKVDMLAGAFVISRIAYIFAYITDVATVRSIIWAIGLGCIVGLFAIA